MAAPNTRTWVDEVTDAQRALDDAEREIKNWRAHLAAVRADPRYAHALNAGNSAAIVHEVIRSAAGYTHTAVARIGMLQSRDVA